ncbi:hypothetical protein BDY21DRAFT_331805 [Lineolata rhizophorae]|uniref:Uncharacterized protein n=1 Tax=Lineolata rhizophorae TaxID=578093 RepID=A0A6A6PBG1_9PEZI|nr:hypothetical protein BDY21DRAFT_331805 [Lineolata rhizophorae]
MNSLGIGIHRPSKKPAGTGSNLTATFIVVLDGGPCVAGGTRPKYGRVSLPRWCAEQPLLGNCKLFTPSHAVAPGKRKGSKPRSAFSSPFLPRRDSFSAAAPAGGAARMQHQEQSGAERCGRARGNNLE